MKRLMPVLAYAVVVTASGYVPALAAPSPCALATSAQVSAAAGQPVGSGTTTGPLGSVCEWRAESDSSIYVNIQRFDKHYWSPERMADGYRTISGIGEKAFAVPELGGWKACALAGKNVVCVNMSGGRASAAAASALLKTSLQRIGT
ncbi:MAG: hypothetical protein IAI48_07230 [Candidatus Eremiobacteraeota bacterium]|nr:hypothetical protein [Candidatus Eremiobacteraeota bacterium]